jgi:hypothetical protein
MLSGRVPSPLRSITLHRRTMGIEKPMKEIAAVSGMSPVQNVRYVTGPYPPSDPLPPLTPRGYKSTQHFLVNIYT